MSEVEVEVTIVFEKPSRSKKGYLRRVRRAVELGSEMKGGNPTPETVDKLVSFLLPFVTEPADRQEAEEALWDASEGQFYEMLAVMRGGENPPLPPQSDPQ